MEQALRGASPSMYVAKLAGLLKNRKELGDTVISVFPELKRECDISTQLFAAGLDKNEIADIKCRSCCTINNQIQTAFRILNVRNGRQLAIMMMERLQGILLVSAIVIAEVCGNVNIIRVQRGRRSTRASRRRIEIVMPARATRQAGISV